MTRREPGVLQLHRSCAAITLMVVLAAVAHVGPGSAASPDASSPPRDPTLVIASGPFGAVAGLPLDPAAAVPDPSTLEALDAWGRNARLSMAADGRSFAAWRVTALQEPIDAGAEPAELGSGAGRPALRLLTTGLFLVRLDATLADPTSPGSPTTVGSWLWRIAVPDRDVPGGGDPYPPAPALVLESADDQVELDPGSGCFVGTCGDIGATSPPRTLPTIRTRAGAPLLLHLADGSGMTAWTAEATAIGGSTDRTVPLGSSVGDAAVTQGVFAAPTEGRWVLLAHVTFDRDRGSFDGYGRLILGSADR